MLDHAHFQAFCEVLCCGVQLVELHVTLLPPQQSGGVVVRPDKQHFHRPSVPNVECANTFLCKTDLRSHEHDRFLQGGGDIIAKQCGSLSFWRNPSRGVFPETPCCLRFLALKLMDTAAHSYRCPVVPFPMKFTFNPLFQFVNRSLKKLETVQVQQLEEIA